jgi:serine/threonine protein kinase
MSKKQNPIPILDPTNRFQRIDYCFSARNDVVSFKGYDREEGREVSWHEVSISSLTNDQLSLVLSSSETISKLKSPNILMLLHFWLSQDNKKFFFITESLSNQSIASHLENDSGQLKPAIATRWFQGVLHGIEFLHSRPTRIVHGKIDLRSIFFKPSSKIIKLRPPMISPMLLTPGKINLQIQSSTPPEALYGNACTASDIWTFGITMLTAVTKCEAYCECGSALELALKLKKFEPPQILSQLSDPLMKDLISKCFKSTSERSTASDLLKHPFFKQQFKPQKSQCLPEHFELMFSEE